MDSPDKRINFLRWLSTLEDQEISVVLLLWSIDKHYLNDLERCGVQIVVPSHFIISDKPCDLKKKLGQKVGHFVVKPTISAAAKYTFRIIDEEKLKDLVQSFKELRKGRDFIL